MKVYEFLVEQDNKKWIMKVLGKSLQDAKRSLLRDIKNKNGKIIKEL